MNFALSDDQESVLTGLEQLVQSQSTAPSGEPLAYSYAADLDAMLAQSGFLEIAREEGFGPLDAALVVERLARLAPVVEAAASALVGPILPVAVGIRPIALVAGDGTRPARFLPMARVLVILRDDGASLVHLDGASVEPVESLLAYPYGRLRSLEGLEIVEIEDVAVLRRRWRIAIAVEAAGCMAAALDAILDHVKTRFAFGRPLGAFQAIQHRLAMAAETAESTKWLAFRAAWSDSEADAAGAACFAQSRIAQFTYDLHQFSGAMGLTLEFPLHFWTYRLRALAGELGGASAQARATAAAVWGAAA
jgi:alkylation response protein AidB-like acyl-CoA dehydrogenase